MAYTVLLDWGLVSYTLSPHLQNIDRNTFYNQKFEQC